MLHEDRAEAVTHHPVISPREVTYGWLNAAWGPLLAVFRCPLSAAAKISALVNVQLGAAPPRTKELGREAGYFGGHVKDQR